tara:strand:- start:859 stop:1416 length:558 start_codon:yes stop_codon:yes gene_type:complete
MEELNLTLIAENDPRLKQPCEDWDFKLDGDPTELIKAMTKVMFNPNHPGIGLAAPQLGVMKNIFIMGTDEKLMAFINPKIDELKGEQDLFLEGCLSYPDLWLHVRRHTECVVSYHQIDGKVVKEKHMEGIQARVFLHEYDHLLGVTFEERVTSELSLELAKKRRAKKKRQIAKMAKRLSKSSSPA